MRRCETRSGVWLLEPPSPTLNGRCRGPCCRKWHRVSARIMGRDGVKLLLASPVSSRSSRPSHVRLDAGDDGRGKGRIEATLGWTADSVAHPARFKHAQILADEIDWAWYLPPPGFHVLPRRCVAGADIRLARAEAGSRCREGIAAKSAAKSASRQPDNEKAHRGVGLDSGFGGAGGTGIEPATCGFGDRCSA